MKKIVKISGIVLGFLLLLIFGLGAYIKTALPNTGAAPTLTVERTPERIGRGAYLANHVCGCMVCHTPHTAPADLGSGGNIYDEKMGFPGTYYSPNITPAGLQSWTDGEIYRAITTGVRKNGNPIFPLMPYHLYGRLDPEDIKSVIAYLRQLRPIRKNIPVSESNFPMSFIINTIPKKADPGKLPRSEDSIAYGKYLFTAAACQECHTPFKQGKPIDALFIAGGREFILPTGIVRSANLTPDMTTGIGKWKREDFIARFTVFRDSGSEAKMAPTVMPWTALSGMKDEDLAAIFAYLRTIQPINHSVKRYD